MKRLITLAAIMVALGAATGSAALIAWRAPLSAAKGTTAWKEIAWPFPVDAWGAGRAFVCAPTDCGVEIQLSIRPKIGFCNCSTGVSDDAELDRIGDVVVLSADAEGADIGEPVKIGWMSGRSRGYRIASGGHANLLSIAFNDECDVVVALAATHGGDAVAARPAIIDFLRSRPMVLWAKKELGLEFVHRDW